MNENPYESPVGSGGGDDSRQRNGFLSTVAAFNLVMPCALAIFTFVCGVYLRQWTLLLVSVPAALGFLHNFRRARVGK